MSCIVTPANINNFTCDGNVQTAYFMITLNMLMAINAVDNSEIEQTDNFKFYVYGGTYLGLSVINGSVNIILISNTYDAYLDNMKNKFLITTVVSQYLRPPTSFNNCDNCYAIKSIGYYISDALDLAVNEAKLTYLEMIDRNYDYDYRFENWIGQNSAITVERVINMVLPGVSESVVEGLQMIFPNAIIVI